jgi:hypothetical protein
MRAASILAGFGSDVTLWTVTGPGLAGDFIDIAKRRSIKLESTSGSADIWFRYRHPLARPDVYPAVVSPAAYPNDVVADRALVFGMLEGRPKVLAKRVVYDPQDGFRARPFDENGSTAEELLIIASLSEGRALTAEEEPEKIARALLAIGKCVGVIIKCGPQGALIATATAQQWIRPFPSKRVWKIGSGRDESARSIQEVAEDQAQRSRRKCSRKKHRGRLERHR